MSARYFMDLTELFNAGYTTSSVTLSLQQNEGATLSPLTQWSGNIYYFTVDFTGTPIYPVEWNQTEKDVIVRIAHPTAWSSANDWSYQGLTGNPDYDAKLFTGRTQYIPVYSAGVLLWGQEPGGGGGATPTRTNTPVTPVITNTPTRTRTSTSGPSPTRTRTPTAGPSATRTSTGTPFTVLTSTSTPTPTIGIPTNTATRTPTATTGPSLTPTRTFTPTTPPVITNTPTNTVGACSPVTSTITVPFTFDGAGTFCWQAASLGGFINSWNTVSVSVNGMNVTNIWVGSGSYPAKINNNYYVSYNSSVAWGHFEVRP